MFGFYDGLCGYTDEELDEFVQKAKALGFRVRDRRKWWNRIFSRKTSGLTGEYWNVKTKQSEKHG